MHTIDNRSSWVKWSLEGSTLTRVVFVGDQGSQNLKVKCLPLRLMKSGKQMLFCLYLMDAYDRSLWL